MAGILAWFWNERFWLPHNVTWADLQSTEEAAFPQAEDLYLAFPPGLLHLHDPAALRKKQKISIRPSSMSTAQEGLSVKVQTSKESIGFAWSESKFIAKPCALGLKVQANGPQKAQPNAILEKVFTAITKHPDEKRLDGLSKQLDWDVRSIQRWFRQRRNQEKPSTLTKFCESIYMYSVHLFMETQSYNGELASMLFNTFNHIDFGISRPVEIYILPLYIYLWSTVPEKVNRKIVVSSPAATIALLGRQGISSEYGKEEMVFCQQCKEKHMCVSYVICVYQAANVRPMDTLALEYQTVLERVSISAQDLKTDLGNLTMKADICNGNRMPLMPDLHYYYIVELSFYWSLMFSQFIDIKRKDFGIMFTHHIVTVTLITFSYVTNLTRVGTLTLCLHDAADVVLEAAKMANYCKCQKLSDLLFLTFAIVFIVSRLGIYPLWILNTTLFELYEALGNFPALWVFNVLLVILQILHCFWSYLIVKAAYKAISKGKAGKWNPLHVAKDDRSDIESSSDEEETVPRSKTPHSTVTTNGTSGANGTNGYLTGSTSSEEH
ncbi:hypothetical protein Q9966_008101 [Columba livia]|nr:hypothetical protein Q9966_008101 [Columba livia]